MPTKRQIADELMTHYGETRPDAEALIEKHTPLVQKYLDDTASGWTAGEIATQLHYYEHPAPTENCS